VRAAIVAKLCMLFYTDYGHFDPTPRKEEKLLVSESRILRIVYETETEEAVYRWRTSTVMGFIKVNFKKYY
jgi:hypothetical protein